MQPCADQMNVTVTCPLLSDLLASAVTTEHVAQNRPDIPRMSGSMHTYAQSFPSERHLVPVPDNGQLMLEWLEGIASGQGRRLYPMPSVEFAQRYPDRATLVPREPAATDPALIESRA